MQAQQAIWIYLSPHLDDAVLSCGGMIWEQAQRGICVQVWTIFAADPPADDLSLFAQSLHDRWGSSSLAVQQRREEDAEACVLLNAVPRYFPYSDCIYRRHPGSSAAVIMGEDDLFRPDYAGEAELLLQIREDVSRALPEDCVLVAPAGIGNHIDHQLVRSAVETIQRPTWYYPDFPYADLPAEQQKAWEQPGAVWLLPVSEAGLFAWQRSISAYRSQISTFWSGEGHMHAAIREYWRRGGGALLRR